MIESELNSLVEQSKDSTKFTPLEAKFVPLVVERINKFDSIKQKSMYLTYFNLSLQDLCIQKTISNLISVYFKAAMQDYTSLVESCAKETGETFEERTRKIGYHTALITDQQEKNNVETMLEALRKLGLVQIHDKITRATRITACHPYDKTEAHPKELHSVYTGCYSYKITDYGKKLLEEHKKFKKNKQELILMSEWKLDEKLDQLLKDYETECFKEGMLDKPIMMSGEEEYSARRIIDEVRKGTEFGKRYVAYWQSSQ